MGVYVIAEAGVNHNGSLETALRMVDAAAHAGADAVKFQTFSAEALATAQAPKAGYQAEMTGEAGSQLDMLRALELSRTDHEALQQRCRERGIEFLSAAFDLESVELLASLGLKTFKVPSGAITDLPYLRAIGALGGRVIVSTGMATLAEVRDAVAALESAGTARCDMVVLHCTTAYPTAPDDVNLTAMCALGDELGVSVGYSDHTLGLAVPIAAVALGAAVIEKHFTLDRSMSGPDHRASLEPTELAEMVASIRIVERALGDGVKRPSAAELGNTVAARKSIVAARDIAAGETLSAENLTTKRPATGISPMRWDEIVGTSAIRAFAQDEAIEL